MQNAVTAANLSELTFTETPTGSLNHTGKQMW